MADIFVSYTSQDRDWAEWIGQELEKLGHVAHIDAWEISGGGDIAAWMDERHDKADHILCVVSETYLSKPYSSWERRAGQWAAQTDRPNFVLPVRIEDCKLRTLLASVKHCDLFGIEENETRARLTEFLKPAARPTGPVPFPGGKKPVSDAKSKLQVAFPGQKAERRPVAISNIPISVPRHFLGRDDDLAVLDNALNSSNGRAAISALHGLRGVGKTTLAAAYADRHRHDYRVTWWIRAETESTMRADLVGLGVQMNWVATDAQEEPALKIVMDRLRDDSGSILLIYDNANSAKEFEKYAPRGGAAHIIVTSNAPDWRGIAAPVEIEVWPPEIGADFLIERTGRSENRPAAVSLSEALGGLPLAHEQAAAYCERLGISLSDYASRFAAAPEKYLDDPSAAPEQYHNGLTVSKTFALAIDEATKFHPAAEPLIVYASLLAPEPIPLYLFSEARERLAEPFASLLKDDGLDEAIGALLAFALVDRESIPDERDPSIMTDCIRLHRLVRHVAAARASNTRTNDQRTLIAMLAAVYPNNSYRLPETWPKARRLDPLAMDLVGAPMSFPEGTEEWAADILVSLGAYRQHVLGSSSDARPLFERALAMFERLCGPDHRNSLISMSFLALLLREQGNLDAARSLFERVLEINEVTCGPDHLDTGAALNNLGLILEAQGDLEGARLFYQRALRVRESARGPKHRDVALTMHNLGSVLYRKGDLAAARPILERSLAIFEETIGRAHPEISANLLSLSSLCMAQRDSVGGLSFLERALDMDERTFGPEHPRTQKIADTTARLLETLGRVEDAQEVRKKFRLNEIEDKGRFG